MSYKEIIDNVSNIEDLDNTTILKVLEKFSKTIKDFAIEQSGLNNLVNVEFIPSDNNTTYTGDSVDYLGTLKLTLSDNIIVNKPCNIKFNIKGSNTIVVGVDEFNNSLELHLDNSVVTTLDFAESERQKSVSDGAIVHKEEIVDVEHIETIYDMSSSDSNINKGYTAGKQFDDNATGMPIDLGDYKKLRLCFKLYNQTIVYFDFGITNNTYFTMCAVCMEPTYSVNQPIMLSVYYSSGNLKCYKAVLGINEGGGNLNNSDNAVLIKVQGVK